MVHPKDPKTDEGDEIGNGKGEIEHGVGSEDEELLLHLLAHSRVLGILSSRNTPTGIFAADTDTDEESIGDQSVDDTVCSSYTLGPGLKSRKDEDDRRANQHTKLATDLVADPTKRELTDDDSREPDRAQDLDLVVALELARVDVGLEDAPCGTNGGVCVSAAGVRSD